MDNSIVVLITGCAKGGIGYEYCKAFAEQGCIVFATDLPQRAHQLLDGSPHRVQTLELDVTSDESVAKAVETIISKHGRIDILVNNAGIGSSGPLAELPLQAVRKAWEVNTLGQLRMVQQVVPHMASRCSGVIVNVGSIVGNVPTPWAGSYCASKAAVHAMSHALRLELRPFGINVVMVMPGAIRSNFGSATVENVRSQEWKLYKKFKESIEERANASQSGKSTDAGVFAREVVKKVLRKKPPRQIVLGHLSGWLSLLSWLPLWLRDLCFSYRFNLNKKV
ncbi:short-chain dehydrogenase PC-15-like [Benincasa hispida]|uniref:short-chain dehydrogenase PC-15-like n=1 Tax=Benincasa hispida TaxID=102211 RepID=UPI00190191B8|nr:short-chain dehydrogenase PC-15-like [Benincasa hispida]